MKRLVISLLLLSGPAWGTTNGLDNFDIEPTGADTNGCSYHQGSGGTNYVMGAAGPKVVSTAGTITTGGTGTYSMSAAGAIIFASGGYAPSAADVGNGVMFQATTGPTIAAQHRVITSVTPGNGGTWFLDQGPASSTATNATFAMGGPCLTPNHVFSVMSGPDSPVWIKSATYQWSTTQAISTANGLSSQTDTFGLYGYSSTWGDIDVTPTLALPVLQAAAGLTTAIFTLTNNRYNFPHFRNLIFDCNGIATNGINQSDSTNGSNLTLESAEVKNCLGDGIGYQASLAATTTLTLIRVNCHNNNTAGGSGCVNSTYRNEPVSLWSWYHDQAAPGIYINIQNGGQGLYWGNLFTNLTGAATDAISVVGNTGGSDTGMALMRNEFVNIGRDGMRLPNLAPAQDYILLYNNLFYGFGEYAINPTYTGALASFFSAPYAHPNACFNTAGASCGNLGAGIGFQMYTSMGDIIPTSPANPFVSATDFRYNTVPNGGLVLKNRGQPGTTLPPNGGSYDFGVGLHPRSFAAVN